MLLKEFRALDLTIQDRGISLHVPLKASYMKMLIQQKLMLGAQVVGPSLSALYTNMTSSGV